MYAVYKLREKGLSVRAFEAGNGVGGTWYWNRYPGARVDSQSYVYQYWFSDELLKEWNWSERFPAQEETERYLNHVADRFDLRKDIQFNTRVTAASYDEAAQRWTITTADGKSVSAQFFVMGSGGLSVPSVPPFPGHERYKGQFIHTAHWPKEGIDLKGKRVGVIGTGATGIQVIQTIAPEVKQLTVFQRTPNYTIPMRNPKYDDAARAELRAQYPALKERVQHTFAGFDYDFGDRSFFDVPPEERQRILQKLWDDGSLGFWVGGFREVFSDEKVNAEISDFVRQRIRARIRDPKVADKLVPASLRLRHATGSAGDRLLRGLQPRQRAAGRHQRDADRVHHREGHQDVRRGARVRRPDLRHRLRCRHRRPDQGRHPRP